MSATCSRSCARRVFVSEAFEGAPALAAGIDRGTEILAIGDSAATLRTVSDIIAADGDLSDEDLDHTGLSHYLEHLMFKGTAKFGAKQFFEQLEAKGADVNAYTARDFTVYHETITPGLLAKVIEMAARNEKADGR